MDKQRNLAKNLEAIRKVNGQSLAEFAKETGLPKSTLQSVRISGNTTLDIAVKISESLGIPLDSLVGDDRLAEKIDITEHMLRTIDWFRTLSSSEREEVALHFQKIVEVICK